MSEQGGNGDGNGAKKNADLAFRTLGEWLEQDGWHPDRIEGLHAYRTGFAGEHARVVCIAEIRMQLQQFLFYALVPNKVPEDRRVPVSEALTRANWGLRIGNFELDFGDGEVRYKSSVDFEGELLTPSLIRNAIYPAVETLDHYLPAIMAVAYGGKDPAEAIEEIEKPEPTDS
jgi:hypothetical protein